MNKIVDNFLIAFFSFFTVSGTLGGYYLEMATITIGIFIISLIATLIQSKLGHIITYYKCIVVEKIIGLKNRI